MCESKAQGGQRCSANTRPKYAETIEDIVGTLRRRGCFPSVMTMNALEKYATLHASTIDGYQEISQDINHIIDRTNPIAPKPAENVIAVLNLALKEGKKMREISDDIKAQLLKAQNKAESKAARKRR